MQVCHTYHCGTCPQTGTSESDSIGTCFGSSFGSYSGVHTCHTPVWGEWSDGRNPTTDIQERERESRSAEE